MRTYLVELYLPKSGVPNLREATRRAQAAAIEVSSEGERVRCLRSIFVPQDETLFLLYDAPSVARVNEAVEHAALESARVVEVVVPR
jgi:hypothetical protein